jgi:hypothetical protein
MMEERYHATAQNRFYPDISNVNKIVTVEAKSVSPPTYLAFADWFLMKTNSELCEKRTEDFYTKEDYFLSSKV